MDFETPSSRKRLEVQTEVDFRQPRNARRDGANISPKFHLKLGIWYTDLLVYVCGLKTNTFTRTPLNWRSQKSELLETLTSDCNNFLS